MESKFEIAAVGYVRSPLADRKNAPRQGNEGAPDVDIEISPEFEQALDGIETGQDIWLLTWFHAADRSTLRVHPRGELHNPEVGVFATRSPDRPNPIGLHRTVVLDIGKCRLRVQGVEAIDGTPIIDIKPVLGAPESKCHDKHL